MTTETGPVGVGIVGAGVISENYLQHLAGFPDVDVRFVADIDEDRARARAEGFNVPRHGSVNELLSDPSVEIVVNLTIPAAHVPVSLAALDAGKHVWSEKPISLDRESGRALVERARTLRRIVGVAPDTILGAGVQAGVRAVREGRIGDPLSALTAIQNPGPERWHPSPDFLYQKGAGPVLDVGPYYLATLAYVFGGVTRVRAVGRRTRDTRTIQTGPRAGESFEVQTPTNVGAILEFAGGGFALSHFSFDSPLRRAGFVEVTGSDATLAFPDPNMFGGDLMLTRAGAGGEVIETESEGLGRGLGVVDMARAIRSGSEIVASAELALHVIDVLLAIEEAIASEETIHVETPIGDVPILPAGWDPFAATL